MVAPASGFYSTPNSGLDQVRIAYVLNESSLSKSIEILKNALAGISWKNLILLNINFNHKERNFFNKLKKISSKKLDHHIHNLHNEVFDKTKLHRVCKLL